MPRKRLFALATFLVLSFFGSGKANETLALIQYYCVDCHGPIDVEPEEGFCLAAEFNALPLATSAASLKNALDAIEDLKYRRWMPQRCSRLCFRAANVKSELYLPGATTILARPVET